MEGADAGGGSAGRLPGGEIYRIYEWGGTFDGDGYGLYAEDAGSHQGF